MTANKNRRALALIVTIIIILNLFPLHSFASSEPQPFMTGDYIQMGKYRDQDIQWRVIGFGESGEPLLISSEILDYKAYDACNLDMDDYNLQKCWSKSAIRTWLNSPEEGKTVPYLDVDGGINNLNNPDTWAWDNGFLHPDNFTKEEVQLMAPAVIRSTLPERYLKLKVGGTKLFMGDKYHLYELLDDYQKAYYEETIDRVFLINVLQFTEMYESLGAFAYGKMSKACEQNISPKIKKAIQAEGVDYPFYLLRDTTTFTHESLDKVGPLQTVINSPSKEQMESTHHPVMAGVIADGSPYCGIRPAFYLSADAKIISGQGLPKDPYRVGIEGSSDAAFSYEIDNEEPLVTPVSNIKAEANQNTSALPPSSLIALAAMAVIAIIIVVFVVYVARTKSKEDDGLYELEKSHLDEYYGG